MGALETSLILKNGKGSWLVWLRGYTSIFLYCFFLCCSDPLRRTPWCTKSPRKRLNLKQTAGNSDHRFSSRSCTYKKILYSWVFFSFTCFFTSVFFKFSWKRLYFSSGHSSSSWSKISEQFPLNFFWDIHLLVYVSSSSTNTSLQRCFFGGHGHWSIAAF